jgi:hypothetical protein
VGQEKERVAVGLGDGVPEEGVDNIGQRDQAGALAVAGTGLDQGQRVVEHLGQSSFQPRTAQHTLLLAGWDQLASNHQIFERHGFQIIAHNEWPGNRSLGKPV